MHIPKKYYGSTLIYLWSFCNPDGLQIKNAGGLYGHLRQGRDYENPVTGIILFLSVKKTYRAI
jgi:hypothetical protein